MRAMLTMMKGRALRSLWLFLLVSTFNKVSAQQSLTYNRLINNPSVCGFEKTSMLAWNVGVRKTWGFGYEFYTDQRVQVLGAHYFSKYDWHVLLAADYIDWDWWKYRNLKIGTNKSFEVGRTTWNMGAALDFGRVEEELFNIPTHDTSDFMHYGFLQVGLSGRWKNLFIGASVVDHMKIFTVETNPLGRMEYNFFESTITSFAHYTWLKSNWQFGSTLNVTAYSSGYGNQYEIIPQITVARGSFWAGFSTLYFSGGILSVGYRSKRVRFSLSYTFQKYYWFYDKSKALNTNRAFYFSPNENNLLLSTF